MPVIRFTVAETKDIEGNIAFLRRVRALIEEWPGQNRVIFRIITLHGERRRFEWRAVASAELRQGLARLLAARAVATPW